MGEEATAYKHCTEPPWIVRDSHVNQWRAGMSYLSSHYDFLGAFHDGAREACSSPERVHRRHCSMSRYLRNEHVVFSVWRSRRTVANAPCR
jgi:hypothetical protein